MNDLMLGNMLTEKKMMRVGKCFVKAAKGYIATDHMGHNL